MRNDNSNELRAPGRVLVVDDHQQARESIAFTLREACHHVVCLTSAVEALKVLERETYDLIITDLLMPGMTGLEFIRQLERRPHGAQVIMITAHATVASAVEAMRHGAFDYIEKPFEADKLEALVGRAIEHGRLLDRAPAVPGGVAGDCVVMIGDSGPMKELRTRVAQVARTAETVLVVGESGTGKELVARSIHAQSDRASAPLVSLNCPVLSAHLMESELFGHERGAFTGADAPRTGRFELADGGTILLDEITEIDLGLQAKLLRVLQEKTFERVGSSKTMHVDARVIATSNRSLKDEVAAGHFRQDLYYRLAVLPLTVPPLRERREDVPVLVAHFVVRAGERLRREPCTVTTAAMELLTGHHWPGNVRELENIVTRASVLNAGGPIDADHIRDWLTPSAATTDRHNGAVPIGLSMEAMERRLIESTLARFDGHRAKTAEALGIGLRTLSGKLKSYGYAPRAKPSVRLMTA
ncbi:MAG: sigma-54 dependent transcriptional regulator [Pirellulales bacterium]